MLWTSLSPAPPAPAGPPVRCRSPRAQAWPSKAPAPADKLSAACAKAVQEPGSVERLSADAAMPVGSTAAEFTKFIAAERQRWKPVIARAKVKPD